MRQASVTEVVLPPVTQTEGRRAMVATYTIRISENSADASTRWYWEVADDDGGIVARGLSATHAAAREQAGDCIARFDQMGPQQQSKPGSLGA
jgi:hypothetical protein